NRQAVTDCQEPQVGRKANWQVALRFGAQSSLHWMLLFGGNADGSSPFAGPARGSGGLVLRACALGGTTTIPSASERTRRTRGCASCESRQRPLSARRHGGTGHIPARRKGGRGNCSRSIRDPGVGRNNRARTSPVCRPAEPEGESGDSGLHAGLASP